jgi:hypothetical protein
MRLWLLRRTGETDCDEHYGFVVRAPDEATARCEALIEAGVRVEEWDLGCKEPEWGDPQRTTCVELAAGG